MHLGRLCVSKTNMLIVALKFFRTLTSLQDTFYQAIMTHNNTFGLLLDIVYETMPRDNLLNSACLELFEFIKRENIKPFILHVVEKYREKLESITYVDTFQNLIIRYEQMQGYGAEADSVLFSQDESSTPRRMPLNGQRWQGVKDLDPSEEDYFNGSDDEDEWTQENRTVLAAGAPNGSASPSSKSLVDYPDDDDDDEDAMDTKPEAESEGAEKQADTDSPAEAPETPSSPASQTPPPERLSEKRRREEEDDDELGKLAAGPKRRSSVSSNSGSGILNRKKTLSIGPIGSSEKGASILGSVTSGTAPKRIAINLGPTSKASTDNESCTTPNSEESNEKENHEGSQGEEES